MIDNLRNVAIPGTGVPLSVFSRSYWLALWYILFVVPFVCLCGAFNKVLKMDNYTIFNFFGLVADNYVEFLCHPDDW